MFLKNLIQSSHDTVNTQASIQDVVNKMSKNNLHHIIIIEDEKPLGIITEKDILHIFKNGIDFGQPAYKYATKQLITLHNTHTMQYALTIMVNNNIRKIIIIDSNDYYIGTIEQDSLIYNFESQIDTNKHTVHDIINSANEAKMIDENSSLSNALEIMVQNNLTSILVTNKSNIPQGIISESDIIKLAKNHIDQNTQVKDHMHSPLIMLDIESSLEDVIHSMKDNHIRKIIIFDKTHNKYHIISSQDFANNFKGSYTKFLESKLHDMRDTFDVISEHIIELIDIEDQQVIYWANLSTQNAFNLKIDDNITKIIPKDLWQTLFKKLYENKTLNETIKIKENFYQLKAHYITINDDNIIKLFLNDITEISSLNFELKKQNQLQEQLLFNQAKLAQLGEMIGNIAHQWRQPLNAISVASSGLSLKKEFNTLEDEEFYEFTKLITQNATYLSQTIDVFRNFLKEKKELRTLVLQDRIDLCINIVSASLKSKNITLINKIQTSKPISIKMVTGELDQVIINVLNNAKDELIARKIQEPKIILDMLETKNHIEITIEDNAGGIPQEIMPYIFDEYFTTKDESSGTGLGLYMSKKIMNESLKGDILVQNTPSGAKFILQIPINQLATQS